MSRITIDKLGFLRKDGRIIGWTPLDFWWAFKGWFRRASR